VRVGRLGNGGEGGRRKGQEQIVTHGRRKHLVVRRLSLGTMCWHDEL
jgi:hypothetical protein